MRFKIIIISAVLYSHRHADQVVEIPSSEVPPLERIYKIRWFRGTTSRNTEERPRDRNHTPG